MAAGSAKQVRHALEAVEAAVDPMETLTATRRLREAVAALELAAVVQARRQGRTWTQIGTVYGTSKQGAQQRFKNARARV